MKKIFYKKILCKISLIILLVLLGIAEPIFGMGDNQLTSLVGTGVDVNVDADLQSEDMIGKMLDQVSDFAKATTDRQDDKNRQDAPALAQSPLILSLSKDSWHCKNTDEHETETLDQVPAQASHKATPGEPVALSTMADKQENPSPSLENFDGHGKNTDININIDMDIQDGDICEEKIRSFEQDEKLSSFYSEYIAKYYPKAYVIRQKFLDMIPEQVAEALNDIVHVFTKEPWFYFQNSPKGFRLIYYWEYVLDQCGIIHDFLKHAKVNLKTKQITFENGFAWDDFVGYFNYQDDILIPKTQPLLSYLQKNHLNSYTAFFALAFDYQVKFFNEGILLKDLNMANKYFSEIEYLLEKLRNTPKEADYYETTKTCKELLGILKKKLGGDILNNSEKTPSDESGDIYNYYKEFTELNDVV